jgi:prophage DNA circulation protein
MPGAGTDMPQLMAAMQQQLGARGAAMPAMSSDQLAQMNAGMAAMQQAMAQPLSRTETLAVFDELAELGIMTPSMQSEMRDCVMLAPPSASASLGMAGAMMKNMMLPQLRIAREEMANLPPEDREQLATEIVQAMKELPPEDRKAFQEGFGAGFFPPDVVAAVKSKLR